MEAEFARGPKSAVGGLKRYICVDLCSFAVVFGLGEACGGEKRLATGLGGRETGILTANGRKWTRMRPENGNFSRKTGNGQENRRGNFPKSEVRGPRSEVRGRRSGRGRRRGDNYEMHETRENGGWKTGLGGRKKMDNHGWTRMDTARRSRNQRSRPRKTQEATKRGALNGNQQTLRFSLCVFWCFWWP